jgi:GTP-binding protein Era
MEMTEEIDAGEMLREKAGNSCGFVALIGAPNAGKSTLLNQLVGSKISIVTHKVQTTRARIRAIALEGVAQIIFVDTPGIFAPKRKLDEEMVQAAWAGAAEADATVLLIDARDGLNEDNIRIIEGLEANDGKAMLALNKIDLVPVENLLKLAAELNERFAFSETFMISALKGHGVAALRKALAELMPEGPWLYPEDQIADLPMRLLASEITREKLYLRLHDELPYASTVETETWTEKKDGSVRIEQVIFVERDSQKKIVLGKGGQTIKKIGQAAREEIAESLGQTVHLFLFVKVREKWANDPERLRMMGL